MGWILSHIHPTSELFPLAVEVETQWIFYPVLFTFGIQFYFEILSGPIRAIHQALHPEDLKRAASPDAGGIYGIQCRCSRSPVG